MRIYFAIFKGKAFLVLGLVLLIAISFQNCAQGFHSRPSESVSTSSVNGQFQLPSGCTFNGQNLQNGDTVNAFLSSVGSDSSPCQSEVRICNQGVLSGSFAYATCTPGGAPACLFNGKTFASGTTTQAFASSSVPSGASCAPVTLTCNQGVWSGPVAPYATCSEGQQRSCLFNGQTLASGQTVMAFLNSTADASGNCQKEVRGCMNGVLTGSYNYASCSSAQAKSCLFGGVTIPSGGSSIAFLSSSVAYGGTCVQETRTCNNGSLSGSYNYSACSADAPKSCLFNGQTVASGTTVKAFPTSTVPFGQMCTSQDKLCTNGSLAGSDAFATCQVSAPASCTFNGQTIAHGQTVQAYSVGAVPYGSKCESVAETLTCNNGSLGSSAAFATCVVNQPAPCQFLGRTLASGEQTNNAYSQATVPSGVSCSTVQTTVTCNNGVTSAPTGVDITKFTSASCAPIPGASCKYWNNTITDGHSQSGYSAPFVPSDHNCSEVQNSLSCNNGSLQPAPATFPYASCVTLQPASTKKSCTLANGIVVPDGYPSFRGFYSTTGAKIPSCGSPDLQIYLHCSDGVLSDVNPANPPVDLSKTSPICMSDLGTAWVSAQLWLPISSDTLDFDATSAIRQLGAPENLVSYKIVLYISNGAKMMASDSSHAAINFDSTKISSANPIAANISLDIISDGTAYVSGTNGGPAVKMRCNVSKNNVCLLAVSGSGFAPFIQGPVVSDPQSTIPPTLSIPSLPMNVGGTYIDHAPDNSILTGVLNGFDLSRDNSPKMTGP